MAEILNLNKARKARDRAEARRQAETNRAAFGRSKAEKLVSDSTRETEARRLDDHRRETPDAPA